MNKGKLKIFIGMAPGVGKTLTMLKAGLLMQSRGSKVVVGYVETHGEIEEDEVLTQLEQIPIIQRQVDNRTMQEMDVDTILRIKPELVLIDRLEHINFIGTRYRYRYQEIEELLDNGISVITTLNVHHLESLIDIVRQITGVRCTEIVPDRMLDRTTDIELVDMPQEELLAKFSEGKIRVPEYMKECARDFYRKGNLTALREIALRTLAKRVNLQLTDYMHQLNITGPWKTHERLMVAIDHSTQSEELIRFTSRMAMANDAPWYAVYVQDSKALPVHDEIQLKRNFMLVRELTGELIATADTDRADAILRTAQSKNVTQIIIGKPQTQRLIIPIFKKRTVVDKLVDHSGGIDIHIVESSRKQSSQAPLQKVTRKAKVPWHEYGLTTITIFAIAFACLFAAKQLNFNYHVTGLILLLASTFMALFVSWGPVIVGAGLSAALWVTLFIPSRFAIFPTDIADYFLLVLYFAIASMIATLTTRVRVRDGLVKLREHQSSALYSFLGDLSKAQSTDEIAAIAVTHIQTTFKVSACIFFPDETSTNQWRTNNKGMLTVSSTDYEAISWAFTNKKECGAGTDTFPLLPRTYYSLTSASGTEGVLGTELVGANLLSHNDEALLVMFLNQLSLALEKERLRRQAEQSYLLDESQRLYKTLFNSISHELRTPLATIHGAASSLIDEKTAANEYSRAMLAKDIFDAAGRLNRLLENLLNMSRLETGMLKIQREFCDLDDIVNSVTSLLTNEMSNRKFNVLIADEFPFVKVDSGLFTQALANIILNAIQYSPSGTPISLLAKVDDTCVQIIVEDNGPGFPDEAKARVFDKFYRIPGTSTGGTGLGLSIARGFIDAHGGTITAENRAEGGARIIISLPVSATVQVTTDMVV